MTVIKVLQVHGKPFDKGGFLMQAFAWILMKILPNGSPYCDKVRFSLVSYWLVEISELGEATREIGFTVNDTPILFAPTYRNLGLWTDSDRIFSQDEFETKNDFPFDATWDSLFEQVSVTGDTRL